MADNADVLLAHSVGGIRQDRIYGTAFSCYSDPVRDVPAHERRPRRATGRHCAGRVVSALGALVRALARLDPQDERETLAASSGAISAFNTICG